MSEPRYDTVPDQAKAERAFEAMFTTHEEFARHAKRAGNLAPGPELVAHYESMIGFATAYVRSARKVIERIRNAG